jgi:hypothetical protein
MSNVEKLVAALRSGNYTQGQLALCRNGRYCCLGVACRVYQNEVGDLEETIDGNDIMFDGTTTSLPDKVRQYFGFSSVSGVFRYTIAGHASLIGLNDSGEFGFSQIADIIEKRPEGLFHV